MRGPRGRLDGRGSRCVFITALKAGDPPIATRAGVAAGEI